MGLSRVNCTQSGDGGSQQSVGYMRFSDKPGVTAFTVKPG